MTEKAQERAMERPLAEARSGEARNGELPSRKGSFERRTTEARRSAAPPAGPAQEEFGNGMTALVQETTRSLRAAMLLPVAPGAGLVEMQEAFAELVTGMMRSQLRLTEEVMRIYSPQEHLGLMQTLMQQWLDTAVEGQSAMLRAARQTTDQVLRPLASQPGA